MSNFQKYFAPAIIHDRNGPCEIKSATVLCAASTTTQLVAGVAGKKIRVLQMSTYIDAGTSNGATLYTDATDEIFYMLNVNYPATYTFSPIGYCDTGVGESLDIATSAGANTLINVRYVEFTP